MIEEIIKHFGTQYRLAKVLKVERAAVNAWVKSGVIPPKRAIEIEVLTNGKFKAVDITGALKDDE
jgi:adenylosuccinate lyase